MEISKENFDSCLDTACQLQFNGEFEEAIEQYKKLLLVNEDPKLYKNLGQIYLILGRVEEALKNFKTLSRLNPSNKEVYFFLGNCYSMLKRYNEAIKAFEHALKLDSNNPYIYDNMANAWEELKMYNSSLECRQKAITLKPDDAFIQCSIGNTLYKLDLKEEAMQVYKNSACLDPKFADVYYLMGNCLCSMENYKEAIQSYSMTLDLDPDSVDALNNLGNAYFDIGNLDEALSYYLKAKEIDTNNPEVLNNLGDLYSVLGETDEALRYYDIILDNYSDELVENVIKRKKGRCPIHPAGYVRDRDKHYRKYIGNFSRVLHTIAEDKRPFIDIYEIPPQKGRYFWTYITSGMSDIAQNINIEQAGKTTDRTELILYTSEKSIWARKVLYNIAYYPFLHNTYVNYASTIKFDFPFIEESDLKNALLLDTKVEEKGMHEFELKGKKVNFLRVLPVSDNELKYKEKHGLNTLLNKFSEAQMDFIVDITRESVL